jgi:hypothetical protein
MPSIYFFNGISSDIQNHYFQKQYRNDVIIENNGRYYEVYFFTKDALEYEMTKDGFFSLPGLVILEEITQKHLVDSVTHLLKIGYFDEFKGCDLMPIKNRFHERWYENVEAKISTENMVSISICI